MANLTRRGFLGLLAGPLGGGVAIERWILPSRLQREDARTVGDEAGRSVALHAERCLAWGGTDCLACYIACPRRGTALVFESQRPRLDAAACDACGACVVACGTVNDRRALSWVGRASSRRDPEARREA